MDWFCKAGLTAGAVLVVMMAARQWGPRLAGVMAALPTVTAPALGWLAHDRGTALSTAAAIASVSVCAMLAAFALAYAIAARRAGPWISLLSGSAGAALMTLPALAAGGNLRHALWLAVASCAAACVLVPKTAVTGVAMRCSTRRATCIAAVTGGLAALVTTLGPTFGGFASGLLASLPLISGGVLVTAHMAEGRGAAIDFVSGYVRGLFGKIAFGTTFALLLPQLGIMPAMVLACASAILISAIRRPSASVVAWTWPRAVMDAPSR